MFYNFIAKMISDTAGSKAKPYFPFIFSLVYVCAILQHGWNAALFLYSN